MSNFLRSIFIYICGVIFQLIPPLYRLFYDLAGATFFQQDVIKTFSKNLYILLSVVMLFAFAVKALESIINPDLLFDSKKGFTGVLKRSIIALLLIIIIPFAFDKFYEYQNEIMSKSLIEKMILGVNIEGSSDENTADKTGAGQMMAGLTLQSILYLAEPDVAYEDMKPTIEAYDATIGEDISQIFKVAPDINEKYDTEDGEEYIFEFHWFIALIGGIFIIYALVTFCLDTAERVVRLGFLELTAPISVIAYVYGGNDILKNWASETSKSGISVFIRIAGLAFLIFILSGVQDFADGITQENGIYKALIMLLIIIGALMFIKEVPKTIEKIFGISMGSKGGIKGRLGNMVGGDVASKALGTLGKAGALGLAAAGGALAAGAGVLGKGAKSVATGIDNHFGGKGQALANNIKSAGQTVANSKFGQNVGRLGRVASAGMKADSAGKVMSTAKQAYKDDKLTAYNKAEKQAAKDAKQMESLGINPMNNTLLSNNSTAARDAANNFASTVSRDSRLTSSARDAINNNVLANRKKAELEKYQSNHNGVKDELERQVNAARQSGNIELANRLDNLKNQFNDGNISTNTLKNELDKMRMNGQIESSNAQGIIKKLDSMDHLVQNDTTGAIADLVSKGAPSAGAINEAVNQAGIEVTNSETKLNREKDRCTDDKQKNIIENYVAAGGIINSNYVQETNKDGAQYSGSIGPVAPPQNNQQSNSTSNGGSSSNSQASQTNNSTSNGGHTEHTTAAQYAYRNMNSESSGVVHETLQEGINRAANVHDAPTREERVDRYQDLVSAFGTDYSNNTVNNSQSQPVNNNSSSSSNPIPSGYTEMPSESIIPNDVANSGNNTTIINNNNSTSGNQNVDLSGLENTLKRNTDAINDNINNRTSEIKNDIGNTRDDINKNLKTVNDNVVNNINKATNDISENVKKQIEKMPSLNDFFADDNNDSNSE